MKFDKFINKLASSDIKLSPRIEPFYKDKLYQPGESELYLNSDITNADIANAAANAGIGFSSVLGARYIPGNLLQYFIKEPKISKRNKYKLRNTISDKYKYLWGPFSKTKPLLGLAALAGLGNAYMSDYKPFTDKTLKDFKPSFLDSNKDNSYKTLGYTSSGAGIGYLLGDLLSDNKFLPITLAILGGLGGYGISKK